MRENDALRESVSELGEEEGGQDQVGSHPSDPCPRHILRPGMFFSFSFLECKKYIIV